MIDYQGYSLLVCSPPSVSLYPANDASSWQFCMQAYDYRGLGAASAHQSWIRNGISIVDTEKHLRNH